LHLSIDKLSKAYGFLWALRDVRLDFQPGQLAALLGPNGAGKTTLLRLLAGLIVPTLGSICFDGAEFAPGNTGLRRKIGFLSPADHLYENLTVGENLRFFASLYRRPHDAAIEENLAAVQLAARQSEYVANLSSGLKCRLSIAKWRLLQPELLLLTACSTAAASICSKIFCWRNVPGAALSSSPRIMSRACCGCAIAP
jgi:ABC-2 type transport system ATP-binding protein